MAYTIDKSFNDITIEDIIEYCKANKQVDWLKEIASKKIIVKRHTERIQKMSAKTGKLEWFVDKSSPVVEEETNITFVQIKRAFCEKFMPEIMPKAKPKKPTMFDLINAL